MTYCRGARTADPNCCSVKGTLTTRGFQKADCRKAGKHRNPKECGGLALRKIGGAVDKISETSITDLFRSVLNILCGRINATGCKGSVAFKSAGGVPDIGSEAFDEIRSAALLFVNLFLNTVRSSGGHFFGGISRLLQLVLCGVGRCLQRVASALLQFGPGIRHLILHVL